VLPARNEAPNLAAAVEATLDALSDAVPDYELIIVDDGSKDATARIADDLAQAHEQVRVVHQPQRRGYGVACRAGIALAAKQYILLLDADRQYQPADLPRLTQWNDRYDLVLGYRVHRADPFLRVVLGWLYTRLVRLLFGVQVRDVNCGFKLIYAGLLKALPLESAGAAIHAEILYRARERGAEWREAPVRHAARRAGTASGAGLRASLQTARDLFALRRRITAERRAARLAGKAATMQDATAVPLTVPTDSDDPTPPDSSDQPVPPADPTNEQE
jgi:glycosyltransferase involved in cell wall biosynthesis